MDADDLLRETADYAAGFLAGLDDRPVRAAASLDELRSSLGGPLADDPTDARTVVKELAAAADPGVVALTAGRYFGFVIGGSLPAALAADWLTATWDQNAGLYVGGPAAGVVEEVAGGWLKDVLGLPAPASFALVTGCQMAHFTCLAAARHHVLAAAAWDVEQQGVQGAPRVRVLVGEHRHVTIDRALRYLGVGTATLEVVGTDEAGRMSPARLAEQLAVGDRPGDAPAIVCVQVGDVNTGAIDPVGELCEIAHARGAWVHVDGAFGLWAAASPELRPLVAGVEQADSWATDGHKWLNVPYDCGLAFCAHPASHRAAMGTSASYLERDDADGGPREQMDWNPEFSRRARGFTVYAALRSLGRSGLADLVGRSCAHARRFAERLGANDDVEILNDVVLNQVLVRFADSDERTQAVVRRVQDDGTCWLSGTTWRGQAAMRISVCNWQTTESDVDRSVEAILRAAAQPT